MYLVTLKGHANFGLKLNFVLQISPPKIGQFLFSGRNVPTFQILLLSFVWKVNYLNQTTFSFQREISAQISDFISLFCLKSKLLEPDNLHRSFILWHWRAMQILSQNWILLPKSTPQKLVNFFPAGKKGPNFIFHRFPLSER